MSPGAIEANIYDYWDIPTLEDDIATKETLTLNNVLLASVDVIRDSWVGRLCRQSDLDSLLEQTGVTLPFSDCGTENTENSPKVIPLTSWRVLQTPKQT